MEQSINELRNAFAAFADMHRAHFEAAAADPPSRDSSTIENDLRVLQTWTQESSRETISDSRLSPD